MGTHPGTFFQAVCVCVSVQMTMFTCFAEGSSRDQWKHSADRLTHTKALCHYRDQTVQGHRLSLLLLPLKKCRSSWPPRSYKYSYMITQFEDHIGVILASWHYCKWSLCLANCVCISVHDACFSRSQPDCHSCGKHSVRHNFTLVKITQKLIFDEITVLLCDNPLMFCTYILNLFYFYASKKWMFSFAASPLAKTCLACSHWAFYAGKIKTDGNNASPPNVFQNSKDLISLSLPVIYKLLKYIKFLFHQICLEGNIIAGLFTDTGNVISSKGSVAWHRAGFTSCPVVSFRPLKQFG